VDGRSAFGRTTRVGVLALNARSRKVIDVRLSWMRCGDRRTGAGDAAYETTVPVAAVEADRNKAKISLRQDIDILFKAETEGEARAGT
jgi:hypothetical protein